MRLERSDEAIQTTRSYDLKENPQKNKQTQGKESHKLSEGNPKSSPKNLATRGF
jgi:hypothetical protein